MRRSRSTSCLAVLLALAVAPAAADAATVPATGGTTVLAPTAQVSRVLSGAGIAVRGVGGASVRRGRISVPIADGAIGSDGATSVLRHADRAGFALRGRRGRATITGLRLQLDRTPTIRGRIGSGPRRTIFLLRRTSLQVDAAAGTASGRSLRLRLAPAALRSLRSMLRLPKLPAGDIARISVAATVDRVAAPGPTVPGSTRVVAGHADWGVKQSFRRYLAGGFAGGTTTLADGATANADGSFRFVTATGSHDAATGALDARFAGTVRFAGHGSGEGALLRVEIRRPRITVAAGATQGTLRADVTSKSLSSGAVVDYPDVALATLDLGKGRRQVAGTTVTWTGIPAKLTAAGVPAFADFYHEGDDLDPISFALTTG